MTWQVILAVSAILVLSTNSQPTGDQMTLSLKARKLPYDICGESTVNEYTTIGESSAQLGAYPWMAAIGYMRGSKGPFWKCGGSLLTDQFVLTAGHCLDGNNLESSHLKISVVRLGDLDLDDAVNDGASPVDIEVESAKPHPEYNYTSKVNDIGLVKLKTKIQFDALKKPICLPSPEFYQNSFVDFTAVVIGWGRTGNGEHSSLSEASMEVKDIAGCRRNLTRVMPSIIMDERVVCASSPGQDACMVPRFSCTMDYRRFFVFTAATILLCTGQTIDNAAETTAKARRLPDLDTCGPAVPTFGIRIINGKPATLGVYPWMANLGYRVGSASQVHWQCAGSLITDQYVVTAAHCVIPALTFPYKLYSIRLGELDLNETAIDGASPIDFEVEKSTAHENYSSLTKTNDIGLVKLKGKVTYSNLIKPICLPPPQFSTNMFEGDYPTIAGWGRSTLNNTVPQKTQLLEAQVQIKETQACQANVTSKLRSVIIDDNVICASSDSDSCQGDSGGPLMYYDKPLRSSPKTKGNIYLMGIVSYGYLCAQPGYPGVYTRVAKHMAWIIDHLEI